MTSTAQYRFKFLHTCDRKAGIHRYADGLPAQQTNKGENLRASSNQFKKRENRRRRTHSLGGQSTHTIKFTEGYRRDTVDLTNKTQRQPGATLLCTVSVQRTVFSAHWHILSFSARIKQLRCPPPPSSESSHPDTVCLEPVKWTPSKCSTARRNGRSERTYYDDRCSFCLRRMKDEGSQCAHILEHASQVSKEPSV